MSFLRYCCGLHKVNHHSSDAFVRALHSHHHLLYFSCLESEQLQLAGLERPEQSALSSEEKIAALENRVEALSRKNKRLSKALRRNEPTTNDEDITAIPKPKERKFNIKSAMGLEDNQRLFTELQALIRTVAIEAKIDFDLPWKDQEPSDVAAAGRNSYLSAKASLGTGPHRLFSNAISTAFGDTTPGRPIPPVASTVAVSEIPQWDGLSS
ncbi:hypothetical protein R3P38DRAFT_3351384 [Favolaschia claudopus]|uniref:Uncharacterized protein n=1 Tax=Favolaschia claudopus TaxID=2862362 RepID=A0AAW0C4D3_9AGAR